MLTPTHFFVATLLIVASAMVMVLISLSYTSHMQTEAVQLQQANHVANCDIISRMGVRSRELPPNALEVRALTSELEQLKEKYQC